MSPSLKASYEAARRVTQRHARSFYFSSFPLPKLKRLRAYAIYAYCRHCDDWIDAAPPGSRGGAAGELRKLTESLLGGQSADVGLPWAEAFRDTCLSCNVPVLLCHDLIHGVCLDAEGAVCIANWESLREYSYYVASVVGLLMNHVFEPSDMSKAREPAIALGIAMQLTNILRDVREDALMGRVYLPKDELEERGLYDLRWDDSAVYQDVKWREYAADFAARARSHYEAAEPGIALLPDDGSRYCVRCMSRIYGAILDKIESANWDVSQRRYVPFTQKLLLAWQALKDSRSG